MPYTTQRNNPRSGKVVLQEKEIEVVFHDDCRTTFTVPAGLIRLALKTRTGEFGRWPFTMRATKNLFGLSIRPGDEAVFIWLKRPIGHGNDLMIVSRRGLLRAARLASR